MAHKLPPDHPLQDFRVFLQLVWQHLNLPDPTPVQYNIADYLQTGPRRRIIEAFRGIGKSWITVSYVCWLLLRDPDHKVEVISASGPLADSFTTFVKRLIEDLPILQHLKPDPKAGCRDSNIMFDVAGIQVVKDPSVKSVGITGQITGTRADTIIADDIEVPSNSATQAQRDKLSELVKEFDAVLKPGGQIIYLGTPQTEQSLYNRLPERGYEIRVWPVRYPTEEQLLNYGPRIAPWVIAQMGRGKKPGTSVEPARFHDIDLLERQASYGASGFALQFMLDTRLSDADKYPLRVRDLIVMNTNPDLAPVKLAWAADPSLVHDDLPTVAFSGDKFFRPMFVDKDWVPYTGTVMAVDPSGRGKDETTYAIVKMLHGFLYVTAVGGFMGGYGEDEVLKPLAILAKKHSVNAVVVEANFGDGMFSQLLKPVMNAIHPCGIEEVRHSKQKELRIVDTLEPVMNSHRLVFDRSVIVNDYNSVQKYPAETRNHYMLIHQLTRITKEKGALRHDDRLDALAMAVTYWVEAMARNPDKAAQEHRDRLERGELEKFMRAAVGYTPRGNTWTPRRN